MEMILTQKLKIHITVRELKPGLETDINDLREYYNLDREGNRYLEYQKIRT